jgi:hypothetical protein
MLGSLEAIRLKGLKIIWLYSFPASQLPSLLTMSYQLRAILPDTRNLRPETVVITTFVTFLWDMTIEVVSKPQIAFESPAEAGLHV